MNERSGKKQKEKVLFSPKEKGRGKFMPGYSFQRIFWVVVVRMGGGERNSFKDDFVGIRKMSPSQRFVFL